MKSYRNWLAAACLATTALAGSLPAHADEEGPRYPAAKAEELNADQKDAAGEVLKQSSAGLGGPYGMLIKTPELLRRYLMMTEYLRQKSSLPKRLSEMTILLEARLWDADYEWWAHYPLAQKAGVPEAMITDIREGRRPANMKEDEALVYDLVMETLRDRKLTDKTFQRATQVLGEQQVIDVVAIAGFYMMVSAVVIAGRVQPPPGQNPHQLPILIKK
jgi:4-carboxymuconolactone decarboxylase